MTDQTEALEAALPAIGKAPSSRRWVPIRNLRPKHRPRVLAHLLSLNEHDRMLRFGQHASDEQILGYVDRIDFERDLIFGIFDQRLRLLAMAHLAFEAVDDSPQAAVEFGVSVLERARGRGHGQRLFEHAVTHARNRGAQSMLIYVARDNSAMLGIVRRAGAELRFDGTEAMARLELPQDTLGSQLEELMGHQAAEWDYCIKMHAMRLGRLAQGLPRLRGGP